MIQVVLPKNAVVPLSKGHPWAFRDFKLDAPAGTVVQLVDHDRRPVAWGLADDGPIAVRLLGRGSAKQDVSKLLAERIRSADQVRFRLSPPDTDCWRVVNGPGDGLPGVVVDRYGSLAVVRLYSAAWEPFLPALIRAVAALGWASTIYRRYGVKRVDGREGGEVLWGDPVPASLVVVEQGMRMLVRPEHGQKTGLFLDQAEHRSMVRRWSAGRIVANLFAYNGGFSVAAALGGAAHVTTVDMAPDAVEDAKEIFRLNGLDPAEHSFEVADVFKWTPRGKVDLLIVDPPSLARGKRSEGAARRAYQKLHARLGPFVAREGLLASSSCTARLGTADWRSAISDGLAGCGDWSWHWVSAEPIDHPTALMHSEARYLKFALLRRR